MSANMTVDSPADMAASIPVALPSSNDISALIVENKELKSELSNMNDRLEESEKSNHALIQTIQTMSNLAILNHRDDIMDLVKEQGQQIVELQRKVAESEYISTIIQRRLAKALGVQADSIIFESEGNDSDADNESSCDEYLLVDKKKKGISHQGRHLSKTLQASSASPQTLAVEVSSCLVPIKELAAQAETSALPVIQDEKKAKDSEKLAKLRLIMDTRRAAQEKNRVAEIAAGRLVTNFKPVSAVRAPSKVAPASVSKKVSAIQQPSTIAPVALEPVAAVQMPSSLATATVPLATTTMPVEARVAKCKYTEEPEELAEVIQQVRIHTDIAKQVEKPEVLSVVAHNAIQDQSRSQKRKHVEEDEELDYSDARYPFESDSPVPGVYENDEEIFLDLSSDEDEEAQRLDSPGASQSTGCASAGEDELKHLRWDYEVRCEWEEESDDDSGAGEVVVIDPADMLPPLTDEELAAKGLPPMSEKERALKQLRYNLLYAPWKDDSELTRPLSKFKEITEEPSIFHTGKHVPRLFPHDHVFPDRSFLKRSAKSPPNAHLYPGDEDHEEKAAALAVHQEDDRYLPSFFRFGLCFSPSGRDLSEGKVFRTVHLSGLPVNTVIGDLMARIRGGKVVSATILDTTKVLGHKSARVVFFNGGDAEDYVDFTEKNPITFGKTLATVTLVGTPTYPMTERLENAIENRYETRYLRIPNYPQDLISERELVLDLITKPTLTGMVQCGQRAASIEEPYYDYETGVMHLAFASVELAQSAFGTLTNRHTYTQYDLAPEFGDDPCVAIDIEELKTPPPMVSEITQQRGGELTELQKIQLSFTKPTASPPIMPAMPSFGFSMPIVFTPETDPLDSDTMQSAKSALTRGKVYPLLMPLSQYSDCSEQHWTRQLSYTNMNRHQFPKVIDSKTYGEMTGNLDPTTMTSMSQSGCIPSLQIDHTHMSTAGESVRFITDTTHLYPPARTNMR